MTLKDLWELLTETWNAWSTHKAPRSGAALAYDTTFSLTPLLMIVIAVFPSPWLIQVWHMVNVVVSLGCDHRTICDALPLLAGHRGLLARCVDWPGITASSAGGR
jgi:hypothetical protein